MSVQDALGISPDAVDRIIRDRWPAWAAAHPKLPSRSTRVHGSIDGFDLVPPATPMMCCGSWRCGRTSTTTTIGTQPQF